MTTMIQNSGKPALDSALKEATRKELSFWHWLFAPGGRRRWLNLGLFVHLGIGVGLALVVQQDLADRARSVILPLAGVLVGLTFAWTATAITIVSSKEFRLVMEDSRQGVRGTANYFQLAILTVLASTILWAIAGLGPYNAPPSIDAAQANLCASVALFGFTSFAVAECWSAVNLTRLTLLAYNTVRQVEEQKKDQ